MENTYSTEKMKAARKFEKLAEAVLANPGGNIYGAMTEYENFMDEAAKCYRDAIHNKKIAARNYLHKYQTEMAKKLFAK